MILTDTKWREVSTPYESRHCEHYSERIIVTKEPLTDEETTEIFKEQAGMTESLKVDKTGRLYIYRFKSYFDSGD